MLAPADTPWTLRNAAHLLNRAGFGGSPGEVRVFHGLGREAAVESLLRVAEGEPAYPVPVWAEEAQAREDQARRVRERQALQKAVREAGPEEAERLRREANRASQQENRVQGQEAQGWWFRRMLVTRTPLREKMTLFWHDHFATSMQKVRQAVYMVWQNELFRAHAFGNFKALTQKILLDPAMMVYLDTETSRKGRPNENFAREVMELFTLGEGNYSEQDIREAARAITGYQINRNTGKVVHNRRNWDGSPKTLLGRSGNFDGAGVIDVLFEQEAAARLVPLKLWTYFVAEDPRAEVVDALAKVFRESGFEVVPLLRTLFRSRLFYSEPVMRDQIKSPLQFLVQLHKQLELAEPPPGFAANAQQQLGQVLLMPPNVAGWDWGKGWINTNTLLARYNLAGQLLSPQGMPQGGKRNRADGQAARRQGRQGRGWPGPDYKKIAPPELRGEPGALVESLVFRFFNGPLDEGHVKRLVEFASSKKEAGISDAEVAELCHLMVSTPEYQLC